MRVEYYEHFFDIHHWRRKDLLTFFIHKSDSYMRDAALRYNPPCVVARNTRDSTDIYGWALAATVSKGRPPVMMVYVAREFRRYGIGTRLVNRLLAKMAVTDVRYISSTRHATKFYEKVLAPGWLLATPASRKEI